MTLRTSLLLLAAACGTPPVTYEARDLTDAGEACLVESAATTAFEPPASVDLSAGGATVLVTFGSCAPACVRNLVTDCTATATAGAGGTTIAVTATTTWEEPAEGQEVECATICGEWAARCAVALEEGDYTLTYGNRDASFQVPYTGAPPCADAGDGT